MRWTGLIIAGIVALVAVLAVVTPLGRYIARAAWEEGKILAGRRSIAALVEDPATNPVLRAKLELVLEARQFAADSLGFPTGKSFTQFTQLQRDTLVLVLSGAAPDALTPVFWRFPVVGRLPYKGFFRLEDALEAQQELVNRDFDTNLRPASAFSTLGWFNDPLLSTTVRADSVDLVNTVIHELTHNLYFAPGDAAFNESLANFVGARGAEWFFAARGDSVRAARAAARWQDDRLLAAFWGALYRQLDSTFKAHPGDSLRARRIAVRDSVYAAARVALVEEVAPKFVTISPRYAERVALDNSALLARRLYLTDLERFEGEFERCEGSLVCAINTLVEEHRASRP